MNWPTPQDYNEAIQNPHLNFRDAELRVGAVEVNALGLPQPSTGAFASVYKIKCEDRDVAVRCFLQLVSDQEKRYRALAETLRAIDPQLFVNFQYVEEGIRVRDQWYPIVKMDWINGQTLDSFVRQHKDDSQSLLDVADRFHLACVTLATAGIAHGDLQHGNIIISDGRLRLIDYDGMFVPSIAELGSNELGHPNYQHPGRSKNLFSPSMDNFSAWVIHQSLTAFAYQPELVNRLRGCEECLLLRHIDYVHPAPSAAFHILEASESPEVRECGKRLRALCEMAPEAIPSLDPATELPEPAPLTEGASYSELLSLVVSSDDNYEETEIDSEWKEMDARLKAQFPQTNANWPSVRQYTQAMRLPYTAFADDELRVAKALHRNKIIWRQMGKESVVFAMQTGKRRYAVKCFLGDDPTRTEHYTILENYFRNAMPWRVKKHFVEFEYQAKGIKIHDNWYPILKMEWLAANTIENYIAGAIGNKHLGFAMVNQWRELMEDLQKAGISHGNLDPANILISDGRFRLVDYDTMYTPAMAGKQFQPVTFRSADMAHPQATKTIGPKDDHFASWLVDTALNVWMHDPSMWQIVENRHGRLLFRSTDFSDPANSKLFALLYHNKKQELQIRAELLYRLLYTPPHMIPPLQARPLALLPSEQAIEYYRRGMESKAKAGAVVFTTIGVLCFAALPHGGLTGLIPLVALALTLKAIQQAFKKNTDKPK